VADPYQRRSTEAEYHGAEQKTLKITIGLLTVLMVTLGVVVLISIFTLLIIVQVDADADALPELASVVPYLNNELFGSPIALFEPEMAFVVGTFRIEWTSLADPFTLTITIEIESQSSIEIHDIVENHGFIHLNYRLVRLQGRITHDE